MFSNYCSLEHRVENLKKFKSDDGDCPTLVCTDLAARGLDLDVDHVIMFDFPLNSVSIKLYCILICRSSGVLPYFYSSVCFYFCCRTFILFIFDSTLFFFFLPPCSCRLTTFIALGEQPVWVLKVQNKFHILPLWLCLC